MRGVQGAMEEVHNQYMCHSTQRRPHVFAYESESIVREEFGKGREGKGGGYIYMYDE
jgi:hypothetical protein